ncbi:hypothetical protein H2199_006931 [Coniosporium tulheliwenetii]|uniref:Uncharacterized protein n=1 Tax=Coniosporium tulheliwenetii TaxID=3383036 RepID=A0ACC2YSX9_9PEZI|nr:hypothetical protein H2199_006931 [Cladosporium sp. JES 115]
MSPALLLFHRDSVILPTLASSLLGLLTILYNFVSCTRYAFTAGAISSLILSSTSITIYALLFLLNHRKISRLQSSSSLLGGSYAAVTPNHAQHTYYSDPNYYSNYMQNMYPAAYTPTEMNPAPSRPVTDDDYIAQQMALLLTKADPGPSPDAMTETFRIDLPGEGDETPVNQAGGVREYYGRSGSGFLSVGQGQPQRSMWDRMRGRPVDRGRSVERGGRSDERAKSREERRREIELGTLQA